MPKQPKQEKVRADPLTKGHRQRKKKETTEVIHEAVPITPAGLPVIPKQKRVLTPEQREILLGRLELARSARKAKLEAIKADASRTDVTSANATIPSI